MRKIGRPEIYGSGLPTNWKNPVASESSSYLSAVSLWGFNAFVTSIGNMGQVYGAIIAAKSRSTIEALFAD